MWTIVNMVNVTDYVAPDNEDNGSAQSAGIQWSQTLSDPASTYDFVLDDIDQTINVQNYQSVIIFDENAPAIGGVATVPSMNFVQGFTVSGSSGGAWATNGPLSLFTGFPGTLPIITFSNTTYSGGNNTSFITAITPAGYVQPGLQYMLSSYAQIPTPLVGALAVLKMQFQDNTGTLIGSPTTFTFSSTTGGLNQHMSLSAVAPAGAAYLQVWVGGQVTVSGANSGEVAFGTPQAEPMWFSEYGISYPTPDCNASQVNSVLMPDGTCSRKCRLFAGYVEDHTNVYVGKQRHTVVQCASSSKLLETAGLIAASYTNEQDTSIITNVLSLLPTNANIIARLSTGQQNTFSPTSTLVPGVIVDSISFNNSTLREVLNGVSAQSGSIFYVDPYYYLWYVPPSFVGTSVMLSDNPDMITSFPYHDFSIEYDSTNPVNVALVVGSKQKAAAITDTFSGNGSQTVFDLSEPPDNVQAITVGGSSIRGGVDGVDNAKFGSSLTYKALVNKQKQIITFATAPASGSSNVVVTYTYEDQVISQVMAADAIAEQKAQFWGLVSDSNITSTTAAKHRGLTELQDYAYPRTILTLSALNIYLPVGSLILFTCQSENLSNAPFVVQTVDADPQGAGEYSWNYTAGVYNPTIIDHFRNVAKAVKKTPTTANVAIVASIDVALFDDIHVNDAVEVNANGAPPQGPYVYGGYGEIVKADLTSGSAYYRMDASSGTSETDQSGNSFTGTYNGTFTLNQAGALVGDADKSVLFDGSTAYLALNSGLNPGGWTALTVDAWFNLASQSFAGFPRILSNGLAQSTNLGIDIGINPNGVGGFFNLGNGSAHKSLSYSTITFTAGAWYYLLCLYDGTNVQVYVGTNNTLSLVASSTFSGSIGTSATPFNIGRLATGSSYFNGLIDEVAIYKNLALSSGRRTLHYTEGSNPGTRYGFASYS